MRHGLRVGLAMFAMTTALPAGAAAATPKAGAVPGPTVLDPVAALLQPGARQRLSNETTITRWAHANDAYPIRTAARTSAKTITRLRYLTEDEQPEVYLVLDAKVDDKGTPWLHIRIPMRPNGRTGWVPADRLSQLYVVRTQLIIARGARRARLYEAGKQIWESRIGVGKAGTPTPRGRFYVRELLRGDGRTYGPWAFGTSDYSALSDWPGGGVIGIHGTDQPQLIPGAPSHGCVRVPNDKILRLKALMPIGTPVQVVN
jgi:lipoprotein-anchoring transpeptidase ErfK/SrfK